MVVPWLQLTATNRFLFLLGSVKDHSTDSISIIVLPCNWISHELTMTESVIHQSQGSFH
jgi:hypothetical protein